MKRQTASRGQLFHCNWCTLSSKAEVRGTMRCPWKETPKHIKCELLLVISVLGVILVTTRAPLQKRTRLQRRTPYFLKGSHIVEGFHKRCTYGIRVAIKCFLRCFPFLKKFPFSFFSSPSSSLPERTRGGGALKGFAASLGWQQSGQRVVGLLIALLKTSFKQKAEDENKAPPGTSVC